MPSHLLNRLLPYLNFALITGAVFYLCAPFVYAASDQIKQACTSPQYSADSPYVAGSVVQNKGSEYRCKSDAEGGIGSWQWCKQTAYEPGSAAGYWTDAWILLGECGATEPEPEPEPKGNSLKLTFETLKGVVPARLLSRGVGNTGATSVTGTLICKGESLPVSGNSQEPLEITGLKQCDYQLVMDVSEGYAPLNTPRMIKFSGPEGQQQVADVVYRRPVDMSQLKALPGYKVELFAQGIRQPRQMAMGKDVLYVGSSSIYSYNDGGPANFIYALPLDAAGKPTGMYVVASDLYEPHGVAYRDGDLFYSTNSGLYRIRNVDTTYRDAKPELVLVFPADDTLFPLPSFYTGSTTRFWHQKHPLYFNPVDASDRAIYTAVGIPCNVCIIPADRRYGSILRYDIDTGASTIIARGVRNSVGFDWNPESKEIWFSDNNRQEIVNSDEINRISAPGQHFGVPYIFGKKTLGITQQEFDSPDTHIVPQLVAGAIVSDLSPAQINPKDYQPAAFELGMSMAPLGVKYWNPVPSPDGGQQMLVAVHGAGSVAIPGTDVRRMEVKNGKITSQIPLINGWMKTPGESDVYCLTDACIGRPTDFLVMPDNSLLISDDVADAIFRVTYDASTLEKSTLLFHSSTTPPAALDDPMISGYLIDPSGNSKLFNIGWGSPIMTIKGLKYGSYEVNLNDVDHWVPVHRKATYVLSEQTPLLLVDMSYKERDENISAKVTFAAPAKPAGVSADQWAVELVDNSGGTPSQVIQVPWGGRVTETLKYGQYQARYPYFVNSMPEPTLAAIDINESSTDFDVPAMNYRTVNTLGSTVLEEKCIACHGLNDWHDANKALRWSNGTRESFVDRIRSMKVTGHCDATCANQVAEYLITTVWAPYLDPAESIGTRQLRLLTRSEYFNTIKDIFAVDINPEKLPADKSDSHFKYPGQADLGVVEAEDVKPFYDMAMSVANQVPPEGLAPLKGANITTAVSTFGHQLFRRPLTAPETERYTQLLTAEGPQSLIAGMLLSPYFLYRSELGTEIVDQPGVYQLTPNEVATALSYAFLGTTPSTTLMAKAEAGQLDTPEQIGAEVDAMMLTPKGLEQFSRFIQYYTKTAREVQEKPGLTPALIEDMRQEQRMFVEYVMKDGNGTMDQLFNPGFTFLNQRLAEHYGIGGVNSADMVKVTVDDKRGGLLHEGITQIATSDYQATSLVKRGIMVREQMFCKEFGAPVEADPTEPTFPPRAITTRERWDLVNGEHASNGNCWKCHQFMNDTGGAMENYDASGRYRVQENAYNYTQFPHALPIYAGGPFVDNSGSHTLVDVKDVRGIAELIPHNSDAQRCMADSYMRFTFGNPAEIHTTAIVNTLSKGLAETGSMRDMMRTVATSHAFRFKQSADARKQP